MGELSWFTANCVVLRMSVGLMSCDDTPVGR